MKGPPVRCPWCGDDPIYVRYHDEEWGVPVRDSARLFEILLLDGAQAGLSWITILKRREGYRAAFDGFNAEKMARYSAAKIERLRADTRIIRNSRKIESAVSNAKCYLAFMEKEPLSFGDWLWQFVDGKPLINNFKNMSDVPASTPLSAAISKELKQRGFSFVGPTIVYAVMQAAGLVNDHLVGCFCRERIIQSKLCRKGS